MGLKDNYILHKMNNEYVIIEINDGALEFSHVFYINESAAFMFNLLKDGKSKQEIIDSMLDEFDASKDVLSVDYDNFIKLLKEKGIYE